MTRIQSISEKINKLKKKRPRVEPLVRHIIASDNHRFVGRIFDLRIVSLHFESYQELALYADCKYAFDVSCSLTNLTRRVESLNLVGDLLWPKRIPKDFLDFPVSRYQWLTIAADVFLMRFVSVVDCVLILANDVFETGLDLQKCSIDQLRKAGLPSITLSILEDMRKDQGDLRLERNARFHHGAERAFTDDCTTFRIAALGEWRGQYVVGRDQHGRRINVERSFKEGLVELQREFNVSTRKLVRHLEAFYDQLDFEFESRFGPRMRAAIHGLNTRSNAL